MEARNWRCDQYQRVPQTHFMYTATSDVRLAPVVFNNKGPSIDLVSRKT